MISCPSLLTKASRALSSGHTGLLALLGTHQAPSCFGHWHLLCPRPRLSLPMSMACPLPPWGLFSKITFSGKPFLTHLVIPATPLSHTFGTSYPFSPLEVSPWHLLPLNGRFITFSIGMWTVNGQGCQLCSPVISSTLRMAPYCNKHSGSISEWVTWCFKQAVWYYTASMKSSWKMIIMVQLRTTLLNGFR